jgi:hypothetical protein
MATKKDRGNPLFATPDTREGRGRFGSGLHAKLAQDGTDVVFDRLGAQEEPGTDLTIGEPQREQAQDLLLPLGQQTDGLRPGASPDA